MPESHLKILKLQNLATKLQGKLAEQCVLNLNVEKEQEAFLSHRISPRNSIRMKKFSFRNKQKNYPNNDDLSVDIKGFHLIQPQPTQPKDVQEGAATPKTESTIQPIDKFNNKVNIVLMPHDQTKDAIVESPMTRIGN